MALSDAYSWPSASEDSRIWTENTSFQSEVGHICETRGDGGPTVCLLKKSAYQWTHADLGHSRANYSDTASQRRLSSPSLKPYVVGGRAGPLSALDVASVEWEGLAPTLAHAMTTVCLCVCASMIRSSEQPSEHGS